MHGFGLCHPTDRRPDTRARRLSLSDIAEPPAPARTVPPPAPAESEPPREAIAEPPIRPAAPPTPSAGERPPPRDVDLDDVARKSIEEGVRSRGTGEAPSPSNVVRLPGAAGARCGRPSPERAGSDAFRRIAEALGRTGRRSRLPPRLQTPESSRSDATAEEGDCEGADRRYRYAPPRPAADRPRRSSAIARRCSPTERFSISRLRIRSPLLPRPAAQRRSFPAARKAGAGGIAGKRRAAKPRRRDGDEGAGRGVAARGQLGRGDGADALDKPAAATAPARRGRAARRAGRGAKRAVEELAAILDTATDGVLVIDRTGGSAA